MIAFLPLKVLLLFWVIGAASLGDSPHIHFSLGEHVAQNEQNIQAEDHREQDVEQSGHFYHSDVLHILLTEVDQTHEHEQLQSLREVEVKAKVPFLERLTINCETDEGALNRRNSQNSIIAVIIENSYHQGDQNLLEAAKEPEILRDALVVGSDEIYWSCVGAISHPLRLNSFLLHFQCQQRQNDEL